MVYARGERERWSQVGYSAEMIEMREARERGTEREREMERWNQSTSKRKRGKRSVGFGKRRVGAEEKKKKEITAERARSTGMGSSGEGWQLYNGKRG